ncbi:MAG: phosphotriesterase, partial [Solirubrobacteraceae bacterium]
VDDIAESILTDLREGLDGTGVLPALIGEIGTNHPPSVDEWRVVEAAGRAGAESGAAVNVHLSWRGADGLDVVERLTAEGMPADRIVLSHMDERIDRAYHDAVAQTGAVLELDTFGSEFFYSTKSKARNPTDVERLDALEYLLSQGYADQIVLGCDVWAQSNLRHNGGAGYEHLFRRVQPAITWYCGGDEAAVQRIMVDTPRRLLDRP